MPSTKDILNKYSAKLEGDIIEDPSQPQQSAEAAYSESYLQFKQEMIPELNRYERWAQSLGNIIKLRVAEKDRNKIAGYLNTAKLDVTPSQALTLSVMSLLAIFFGTLLIATAIFLITGTIQILFAVLGLIAALFVFYYTYSMPKRLANTWRLKASAEMVPAILYMVVYMKHTANLERAVHFASQHLQGPLALDLKKIFYDIEIGRFHNIKQALDQYLESWKFYAPEFVESFHLIESSLFETSEARRIEILEKSLQVILDGVYEKMLKYSRSIRTPLTNIYMLGIILPTLGLALLPLASTLLQGIIQWHQVFVFFNIIIPFFVIYLTSEVLLKRPGGYGETDLLEKNPHYPQFISKKPWIIAGIVALPLLLIGLSPFLFQTSLAQNLLGVPADLTFGDLGFSFFADTQLFDFKSLGSRTVGPFGPLAVLLSLFIPIAVALFFSIAYKMKTKNLIIAREKTKQLESEFTNSLFQLGNRLGDGVPAELSFGKVAESTQGLQTQDFFAMVNQNIQQLGMSVEKAVFDRNVGAIIAFPSALIATSMRILIESAKKGLQVAAQSLMSISEYLKNIDKINQRLRDLLAEVVSDMRSNMTFLAPLLAGIVVGLATMITAILNKLQALQEVGGDAAISGLGSLGSITNIFNVTLMVPPYFLQVIIGIYLIEIGFILTSALVTVDAGKDPLKEKAELAKNLRKSILLYTITALVSIVALTALSAVALGGLAG